MAIQPIDFFEANFSRDEFRGYLKGNTLKYIMRYQLKNGIEDLAKAETYLLWLKRFESGEKVRVIIKEMNEEDKSIIKRLQLASDISQDRT